MAETARGLILALATILLVCAAAPAVAAPRETGLLFRSIRLDDTDYPYVVYVPRDYAPAKPWPAIVFLHGAGECGSDGAMHVAQGIGTALLWNVKKWPFIVIMPQKPDVRQQWETYDAAVMKMLEQTRKQYKLDATRLYLTGLSQGGHGTWMIGAKHPDVWAAIAPICGYGDPDQIAPALAKMPVWCFHGEADPVVKAEQSQRICDAIKAAGGDPKLTLYPGVGHDSWTQTYREQPLAAWFLEHSRESAPKR